MKHWLAALGATMLMQLVASFMGQSLPVIAPLMMASTGPVSYTHLTLPTTPYV